MTSRMISVVLLLLSTITHAQMNSRIEFDNSLLKISFDKNSHTWDLLENVSGEWREVLHHVSISQTIHTPDSVIMSPEGKDVAGKVEKYSDIVGAGKLMKVQILSPQADWTLSFVLYDGKKTGTLSASVKNVSGSLWKMHHLNLLDLTGASSLQCATSNVLMAVNGYQSWSSCDIVRLDSITKPTSYWSTIFYEPEAYRSLLFGFVTNTFSTNSFGVELFDRETSELHFASASDIKTLEVASGKEYTSDRLMFSLDASPVDNSAHFAEMLEQFAPRVSKPFTPASERNELSVGREGVPNGWCSWYYYYQNISEDTILENLDVAAREFKEAGMKYIQIDDGYQRAAGDWETNKKFPHGHKWLVDQIHAKGFRAGLWVAPFAVAESSSVFKEHQSWLLRDAHDSLKQFFANDWWGGRIFALDPSNPDVQSWLYNLFYTIVNTWGYDYVKIDFLYFAGEGGKYFQNVTSAQAYELGLQAIRKGMGLDKFILACGAPIGSSVGFVDGMRIGGDVYAAWSGIMPGVQAAAQRFSLHNNVWYNDPDCLVVRDPLTLDQARAWASIVTLSGQMNMESDKLTSLPKERIDLVKMTLPGYGVSATPVDLFASSQEDGLIIHTADGQFSKKLSSIWKFSPGDSLGWKDTTFNDQEWKEIPVPSHWEDAGFPNLDGYAWYRVKFTLPDTWKESDLIFSFGKIDDCDQTFINGSLIGTTGTLPPEYNSEWTAFRTYKIPSAVVNWNGENTLAVRVYDGNGPGGIYSIKQSNLPSVWNLRVEKSFDKWNVVGVYNWSNIEKAFSLDASSLGLLARKSYVAYELWSDRFIGDLKQTITIHPTSSQILSIHEKKDRPFILSTSRHITQGGIDLVDERWDETARTLTVVSNDLLEGEYSVVLYTPGRFSVKSVSAPLKYEISRMSGETTKITFAVTKKSKVEWKALFK